MKPNKDVNDKTDNETTDQEQILFINIDANVDKYAIELEKQIQKLPDSLRFIKKYLNFYFMPHLENTLDELEEIRKTPNYDEKVVKIRPLPTRSIPNEIISCIDLLNNNNIGEPNISKMIFGTMKGNLGIYDIEFDKTVIEINLSKQNRVEHITTSTIKYFDTYQTRIAASCRGETNIYILSYNHSFTGITTECILNTITPETNTPPTAPEKLQLSMVISGLKLSKDGYFLSVTDYDGGVRIFNFSNIGIQSQMQGNVTNQATISNEDENLKSDNNSNTSGNIDDKLNKEKKNSGVVISSVPQVSQDNNLKFIFVGRYNYNKIENFTILPNDTQQVDDKSKKKEQQQVKDTKKKDNKKGGKNDDVETDVKNPDEYNIKSEFDEEKGDNSMYQLLPENNPYVHFVQKKFIFADNSNSEYSTSTITVGLYIAFANTTSFKFVSLYEYLTEKMKSIFKVKKVRNVVTMSIEDTMNLNSQMIKKEKDFLQFIRQKLDPKKQGTTTNENNEVVNNDSNTNKQVTDTAKKDNKDTKKNDPKKVDNKNANAKVDNTNNVTANTNSMSKLAQLNVASLITQKEMNFTTCFNITMMSGQKAINKYNNLLGIGMIDGSVLVWDCELHTDKFLFQKNSRFEITSISIDENYLICGTIKGQIYIYELIGGKELYTCMHDPYSVNSFQAFYSFFPFLNLGFDSGNRVCIYNSKECHKAGKLAINNDMNEKEKFSICFSNKFLCDYNSKYIVFVCEKKENTKTPPNILDLINFSKERVDILRNKPNNKTTDFFNIKNVEKNEELVKIPENEDNQNNSENQEKVEEKAPPKKDDKKKPAQKDNNPPVEEEPVPEPVTKLELKNNYIIAYRVLDVLFKCYPNLVYSHKKGLSLKKIMKKYKSDEYPTYSAADAKKEGMQSFNYLSSHLKKNQNNNNDKQDLIEGLTGIKDSEDTKIKKEEVKEEKHETYSCTQRKDIFYTSFKNIKDRHQYKEERGNKLLAQKKKIVKDLKEQNGKNKKK